MNRTQNHKNHSFSYPESAFSIQNTSNCLSGTFNTHELDQTGLSYFNARYYDADTGRFITPDPTVPSLDNSQHYNRYMFVSGNPICFMDASGYAEETGGTQGTTDETSGEDDNDDDSSSSDNDDDDNNNNNNSSSDSRSLGDKISDFFSTIGDDLAARDEAKKNGKLYAETEAGKRVIAYHTEKYGAYLAYDGKKLTYMTKGSNWAWDSWDAQSGLNKYQNQKSLKSIDRNNTKNGYPIPDGTHTLYRSNHLGDTKGFWNNHSKPTDKDYNSYTRDGVNFNTNNLSIDGSNGRGVQIHPDGGGSGTRGCIGLQENAKGLNRFKSSISNYLSKKSMIEVKVQYNTSSFKEK